MQKFRESFELAMEKARLQLRMWESLRIFGMMRDGKRGREEKFSRDSLAPTGNVEMRMEIGWMMADNGEVI